jgi:hypothetical protein
MRIRRIDMLVLWMSLALLTGFAVAQSSVTVDVAGLKTGMAGTDVIQALRDDNAQLKIVNTAFRAPGIADAFDLVVNGDDIAAPADQADHPTESVQVLLTPPPATATVWSVWRRYTFATSQRPSQQATLDALVKKYGPPSVPPASRNMSPGLAWVYDAQGKPMGPGGAQLSAICLSTLNAYAETNAAPAMNSDLTSPRQWPAQCLSIVIVIAQLSGVPASANTFAVSNLDVSLWDGGRYRKALDATQKVVQPAIKAQKNGDDTENTRPAPKL